MVKASEYSIIGLDPRDMHVYEALYKLNKGSLRALAQSTGMNRGTIYEIIKKLTGLGLVTFTQVGSRRRYMAADPEVFLALIREQRDRLQNLERSAGEFADDLQKQKIQTGVGYTASFYEGDEGIASILRDVLQTVQSLENRSYLVISSSQASSFIYNNFKSFTRQRIKLGISVRVLSNSMSTEKPVLAERRQLRSSPDSLSGYILIYSNKTALISLSDTNELSGIVVSDDGITAMQRQIFNQLWETSK